MLFDSHSHMYSVKFDEDRDEVFKRIQEAGVKYVLNAGADLETSMRAIDFAQRYNMFYASVGCHPHDVKDLDEETLVLFKGLAKKTKVCAIGEIGLDYYYNHSPRDVQQYWFRRQIQLAHEVKMPIIIHDRDANDDTLRILKEENAFDLGVVMHCFSGSAELAKQYVKLGAMISIAGTVTFKNARKLKEVVETVALEHLFIETDAPYLTPEPYRGKRNESSYVQYVAKKIAELKGVTFEEVAEKTTENTKHFFGIK